MADATKCDRCGGFFEGKPVLGLDLNHHALGQADGLRFEDIDDEAYEILRDRNTIDEGGYCGECAVEILNAIPAVEEDDA